MCTRYGPNLLMLQDTFKICAAGSKLDDYRNPIIVPVLPARVGSFASCARHQPWLDRVDIVSGPIRDTRPSPNSQTYSICQPATAAQRHCRRRDGLTLLMQGYNLSTIPSPYVRKFSLFHHVLTMSNISEPQSK